MRKHFGWLLLLFVVAFSLLLVGCTDNLGLVDFSGELRLADSNDGWGYRVIAQADPSYYDVGSGSRLVEYRNELALDKSFHIGKTDYLFVSRFQGGFSPFANYVEANDFAGFQTQVYNFNAHRRVKFFVVKQSDSGDDWNRHLDNGDDQERHYLERSGEFQLTFFDEDTGCDYIVTSTYKINSDADRRTDKKGNFIIDDHGYYTYDNVTVKGHSQIAIGTRKCLYAEKMIGDKKIGFYVLDWNLDGRFNEDDDLVYCNYHGDFLNFNKTVRLTNSDDPKKDNKYLIRLIKPANPHQKYRLQVTLVEVGLREKKS